MAPQASADESGSRNLGVALPKDDNPAAATPLTTTAGTELDWPRSYSASGVGFDVHEPRVEGWDGAELTADAAVIVRPAGQDDPVQGVVRMTAHPVADQAAGVVTLQSLTVTAARFPAALDKEQAWLELLRSLAPRSINRLGLSQFEAGLARVRAREQARAGYQRQTPSIIVTRKPMLLVAIDGEPRFVPIPDTGLTGVRNTRAVLLKDAAGKLYLRVYDGWVGASALSGPWRVVKPPAGAEHALQLAKASGRVDLLEGGAGASSASHALNKGALPQIVVSTRPAVLIGVDGEPKFVPVAGTGLQYATNTSAPIYRDSAAKKVYVLAAGRWYQAASGQRHLDLTPADQPPADLARMPTGRAHADGIAGAAKSERTSPLPAIVAVSRKLARFAVSIDGEPKLEPIAGTRLSFVANASAPIIQVDSGHCYGSQNGVWFAASTPRGPWSLADQVPVEIYTIPPSSAVYHTTYARVFASTPDSVYFGYDPTYFDAGTSGAGEDTQATPPPGLIWGWLY